MKVMEVFYDVVKKDLEFSLKQEDVLQKAVQVMVDSIASGGVIHVFGCGHSQLMERTEGFADGVLETMNLVAMIR